MRHLALTAILAATPALADVSLASKRMSLIGPSSGCFERVQINNTFGWYNETETLATDHGNVSIEYTTKGGHAPGNPDYADVLAVPPGVAAVPHHLEIEDGDQAIVCLLIWEGS